MTKSQIRAELRRSAMEDRSPAGYVAFPAFSEAMSWKRGEQSMWDTKPTHLRWFFLLVAEAL